MPKKENYIKCKELQEFKREYRIAYAKGIRYRHSGKKQEYQKIKEDAYKFLLSHGFSEEDCMEIWDKS